MRRAQPMQLAGMVFGNEFPDSHGVDLPVICIVCCRVATVVDIQLALQHHHTGGSDRQDARITQHMANAFTVKAEGMNEGFFAATGDPQSEPGNCAMPNFPISSDGAIPDDLLLF